MIWSLKMIGFRWLYLLFTNMRLMVPKSATGGLHKNSRLRQIKGLSPARRPSSTTPFLSQREDWLENHVLLAARKGSKKAAADSESFFICILEIPRWLASGRGAEQLSWKRYELQNWRWQQCAQCSLNYQWRRVWMWVKIITCMGCPKKVGRLFQWL